MTAFELSRPEAGGPGHRPLAAPLLDIVVPAYNEEMDLEGSVRRPRAYLDERGRGRALRQAWRLLKTRPPLLTTKARLDRRAGP